jgi:hypothetical protein
VEFFDLVLQTALTALGKQNLLAFLRVLQAVGRWGAGEDYWPGPWPARPGGGASPGSPA